MVTASAFIIKKLLHMGPAQHGRSSNTWQSSQTTSRCPWPKPASCDSSASTEYVSRLAPHTPRKMAKSFTAEVDTIKLQVIHLAGKLYLTNSKQLRLLTQCVLSLAKYNWKLHGGTHFTRQLILPSEQGGTLSHCAKKLFYGTQTNSSLGVFLQRPGPLLAALTVPPVQCQSHRLPGASRRAGGSPRSICRQHGGK